MLFLKHEQNSEMFKVFWSEIELQETLLEAQTSDNTIMFNEMYELAPPLTCILSSNYVIAFHIFVVTEFVSDVRVPALIVSNFSHY